MKLSLIGINKIGRKPSILLLIPLLLSAFTHFWNPAGFPSMYVDEAAYMQRAMIVLEGNGPRDITFIYDHPYFGQFFLAGVFRIIAYPDSFVSSIARGDIHSIEMLHMIPRLLMGILAVIDTFLLYKISERRYNRNVALVASVLFAVMPMTWLLRRILLDNILLPFLLSSILFALYTKYASNNSSSTANSSRRNIMVLLSGIFLGLAIFTKIPVFVFVPLVAFLILKSTNNNKNLKILGLWFIPVVMIPLLWPTHAFSVGEFDDWLHGIFNQTHRNLAKEFPGGVLGIGSIFDEIAILLWIDPVLLSLGLAGLVYAAIKRDFLLLLWIVPLLLFLYLEGFVQYFYVVPLLPAFCIAAARITNDLSNKAGKKNFLQKITSYFSTGYSSPKNLSPLKIIYNNKIQKNISVSLIVFSVIAIFGLICTTLLITTNVNSSFFQAFAFISKYISDNSASSNIFPNGYTKDLTVISNGLPYTWIPNHVLRQGHYQIYNDPVKTEKVLLILQRHNIQDFLKNTFLLGKKNVTGDTIYNNTFPIAAFKDNMEEQDINKKHIYPYNIIRLSSPLPELELRANILFLNSSGFMFHINQNGPKVTKSNGAIHITIATNQSGILPSYWNNSSGTCNYIFRCVFNSTATGWNGKGSLQLSTNTTNKNTWSWIYGNGLAVNADQTYKLVTHMKLNEFVKGSHIAVQGYNQTNGWYQISQCPSGTNGPLEWKEYSCEITIPANTTRIRPVLNAGWSSQAGKQATTLFDSIYFSDILSSDWEDPHRNCDHIFNCTSNSTTGWKDNASLQLSTNTTNKNTWSFIYGNEIIVNPRERYTFTTHMKLNEFARGSHIVIETYNVSSKKWQQTMQCPSGTNGPLEWKEYSCEITIPANTTRIRPVLNAGWSSQAGKQATTLFDSISLGNISQNKTTYNSNLIVRNLIPNPHFAYADDEYARFISLCKLRGDFDVQMTYRLINWTQFNGAELGLFSQTANRNTTDDNPAMSIERISLDPNVNFSHTSEVYATHFNDGVHMVNATHMDTDSIPATDKSNVSGKLRMVRSGLTVTGYYYRSGTWIPIHSSTHISLSDVNILLQAGTRDFTHKPAQVAFLSYLVTKGNMVDCQTR